jgi:hypothetical protein
MVTAVMHAHVVIMKSVQMVHVAANLAAFLLFKEIVLICRK